MCAVCWMQDGLKWMDSSQRDFWIHERIGELGTNDVSAAVLLSAIDDDVQLGVLGLHSRAVSSTKQRLNTNGMRLSSMLYLLWLSSQSLLLVLGAGQEAVSRYVPQSHRCKGHQDFEGWIEGFC